jgi:hypothetical protein
MHLILKGHDIALKTCASRNVLTGMMYMRPAIVQRRMTQLIKQRKALLVARHKLRTYMPQRGMPLESLEEQARLLLSKVTEQNMSKESAEANPMTDSIDAPYDSCEELQERLARHARQLRCEMKAIDDEHDKHTIQQHRLKLQQWADVKQKFANQAIVGGKEPAYRDQVTLRVVRDQSTGLVTADPLKIISIIEHYERPLHAPPGKIRNGHYLPCDNENDPFPWEAAEAADRFQFATKANELVGKRTWLHDCISSKSTFRGILNKLKCGKAGGPDHITNDMLRALPSELTDLIHDLMCIMWATGCTPTKWVQSNTVLIYKGKNDPLHLDNYRPIGLMNTICKVWTSLITYT